MKDVAIAVIENEKEVYLKVTKVLGKSLKVESVEDLKKASFFNNPQDIEYIMNNYALNSPYLIEVKFKIKKIKMHTTPESRYKLMAKMSKKM